MTTLPQVQNSSFSPSVLPSSFNMGRVISRLNKYLNPLSEDCLIKHQVHKVQDGYAYITFALPVEMSRGFVAFLESMAGFFRIVDIKEKSVAAQSRELSLADIAERKRRYEEQEKLVCELFDGFVEQGRSVKEAVSLTNNAMKEKNHPWATYNLVSDVLRGAGRFRTKYKRRK